MVSNGWVSGIVFSVVMATLRSIAQTTNPLFKLDKRMKISCVRLLKFGEVTFTLIRAGRVGSIG